MILAMRLRNNKHLLKVFDIFGHKIVIFKMYFYCNVYISDPMGILMYGVDAKITKFKLTY